MLHLLKNGEVIRSVSEGATIEVEPMLHVCPAMAGWQWPEDDENPTYKLVQAPEPEPEPSTVEDFRAAIQTMLDDAARAKLYDNGLSLSTYVNSTNPQWAAEAQAFVSWRDSVWAYTYEQLALVQAGERDIPTVQEFLQELPQITWP